MVARVFRRHAAECPKWRHSDLRLLHCRSSKRSSGFPRRICGQKPALPSRRVGFSPREFATCGLKPTLHRESDDLLMWGVAESPLAPRKSVLSRGERRRYVAARFLAVANYWRQTLPKAAGCRFIMSALGTSRFRASSDLFPHAERNTVNQAGRQYSSSQVRHANPVMQFGQMIQSPQ